MTGGLVVRMKLFNVKEYWINRGIAIGEKRTEEKFRKERQAKDALVASKRNGKN